MYRFTYKISYGWAGYGYLTQLFKFKILGYLKCLTYKHENPGTTIWLIEKIKSL